MDAPRTGDIESIVRESGRRVRSAHGFTVSTKGTRENLVTSADIENERFLKSRLTGLLPGSAFMGEEGDEASLRDSEWTWIVDPIDGTANFSRGIPMCAVSVALFHDATPYAGFVLNPFTDTLYSAVAGNGAFKDGAPIRVSDRPLGDCILSTAWCCYEKSLAEPVFRVSETLYPDINDIRRIGTAALELSLMAEGAVDMYFEIRLSPWDYAAGLTILREAGGCYTGIGDRDVSFDGPSPILAANSDANLGKLKEVVDGEFGGRVPYRLPPQALSASVIRPSPHDSHSELDLPEHPHNDISRRYRFPSMAQDKCPGRGEGNGCCDSFGKMSADMGGFAPDTLKAIRELDPDFIETLHTMDRVMVTDGALDKKQKRLIALACVAVRMCEDCVYAQAKVAKNYGATREEILEAINVAVLTGGVPCWSTAKRGIAKLFAEWDD